MIALHLALKCLDSGRALAISGDLFDHVADCFVYIGGVQVLPLYGEPLLVGFDVLQDKVAPHFVHDQRTRGGNAGRGRRRRRPAEPRAEIKRRCDPEIQIDAEPAAEGGSQTRQTQASSASCRRRRSGTTVDRSSAVGAGMIRPVCSVAIMRGANGSAMPAPDF